jgi:hypothetical protein
MMDASAARSFATATHIGQRTRSGELLVEHLRRVAEAVAPGDRATAWLHDTLERSRTTADELRACGITGLERDALELLTRSATASYELYVLRIAHAPGAAGRLARSIKLADLDDHLRRAPLPDDPPYAWARRHIANALDAEGEPVHARPRGPVA